MIETKRRSIQELIDDEIMEIMELHCHDINLAIHQAILAEKINPTWRPRHNIPLPKVKPVNHIKPYIRNQLINGTRNRDYVQ